MSDQTDSLGLTLRILLVFLSMSDKHSAKCLSHAAMQRGAFGGKFSLMKFCRQQISSC